MDEIDKRCRENVERMCAADRDPTRLAMMDAAVQRESERLDKARAAADERLRAVR
jgi:hypothetical protein